MHKIDGIFESLGQRKTTVTFKHLNPFICVKLFKALFQMQLYSSVTFFTNETLNCSLLWGYIINLNGIILKIALNFGTHTLLEHLKLIKCCIFFNNK